MKNYNNQINFEQQAVALQPRFLERTNTEPGAVATGSRVALRSMQVKSIDELRERREVHSRPGHYPDSSGFCIRRPTQISPPDTFLDDQAAWTYT
ncbi:MAG: hypothetical protein M3539_03915 [Acidobacteriota bacterium]|nr:hypothetical protein [Acidobacteriota bacterium]